MPNKILLKHYLLHYMAALGILTAGGICCTAYKDFDNQIKNHNECESIQKLETMKIICVGFLFLSLLLCAYEIRTPRQIHKHATQVAKEYLSNLFKNNAQYAEYKYILNDEKSLKKISAIICNGLSSDEQEQISNIVNNAVNETAKSDYEERVQIKNAYFKVFEIINKHESKNPGYLQNALSVFEKSGKTYIMPTYQRTR